ncbi:MULTISPECIES: helix-turn-helix domain-containing protein [unclassified Variovorax]|uniref:helix-turn-helix domain-containing protein n=1 Tax=unclassified Variovorax TaxID=663243 RepID=UPI003F454FFA
MNADDADALRVEMGARLREAREYLNFSQEEVGIALGVSRPAVTNIESGSRKVESLELDKMARLYGRSVTYFLSGEEEVAVDEKVVFAARALSGLSGRDLEEVTKFANYLRNSSGSGARKGR